MKNPIIQRELIGTLRQPRALAIQVVFVLAMVVLVMLVWPDSATVNLGGRQARQLFGVFAYGLLVGLMLLAPALPATSIVNERRRGTLILLLTSPLTPASILFGKVAGAIGFVLTLMVLSLPAAAACFVMGGIGLSQLAITYGVLGVVALQYVMIALYISSMTKSTDGALRMTYGVILLLSILVLVPYYMLQGKDLSQLGLPMPEAIEAAVRWLASLSPLPAVMQLADHGSVGTRGLESTGDPVTRYLITAAITIVACTFGLIKRLQPTVTDRPRDKGVVTDERSAGQRAARRFMYVWFFDPNKRTGTIANYENPVMMKEFRTRTFGRAHWMARLIAGCLVVSLGLMFVALQGTMWISTDYMAGILVVFQMGLIILVTPALSAALISSELESGGWTLLQATPLSAGVIMRGKLLSVAWTLTILLLATLPGYAILWMIDEGRSQRVVNGLITLALTALFSMIVGAMCSSIFRKTAVATTAAYLLLVGLCVVTLLPWMGEGSLFDQQVVERILMVNPLAAALNAVRMPGMESYQLTPANWWFLGGGTIVASAVLWFRTWQLTKPQ
ncbi:MAG: ABC transporter permease subunit [Phycisphaera sp.]|nr:ABC transporter permease subunit [Phycisphaera sp.]